MVRFFLTNAASTRVFNLSFPGARMKLVGGDLGLVERESWLSNVVIAPAERYIVEARFDSAGTVALVNHVQAIDHYLGRFFDDVDTLGIVTVDPATPQPSAARGFETLRVNADVQRDLDRYRSRLATAPDHTLQLTLETQLTLPFALYQALRIDPYAAPVEWSGTMPMMDWLSTSNDVRWILRDADTGRENMDINWHFRVGDLVHLRLVNDTRVLHPMQHSMHIHGQRFLILAVNGQPMQTLMLEGHRPHPDRLDRRSAGRDDQPGGMDAALSHRRTSGERNAHGVRRQPPTCHPQRRQAGGRYHSPAFPFTEAMSFAGSYPTPCLKTVSTFSMSLGVVVGSPPITTRSACFPAAIDPIRLSRPR